MYARLVTPPESSYFLFGPRGTGKSTWLKHQYKNSFRIDLLPPAETLRYAKEPSLLKHQILARDKNEWIIIDEIQKVPMLLDQVHDLIENYGYQKFVLSGSSARKLRRGTANLLAGRALHRKMFPLVSKEVDFAVDPNQCLQFGMLPMSVTGKDDAYREEYLRSYLTTYLSEEIKAEGLVRNYVTFARFLEVAALAAGTAPNISGLSRDAGIGRDTVEGYFSIFVDTLIGDWLPAYRPRAKVKEVASPKFYWFDSGVLNVAAGGFDQPMPRDWTGILLEHWVYAELRAYLEYSNTKAKFGYWATPSETEVDFVVWYEEKVVAIEVKSTTTVRREHLKGLKALTQATSNTTPYLVYLGDEVLQLEGITVLPVNEFCRRLYQGSILAHVNSPPTKMPGSKNLAEFGRNSRKGPPSYAKATEDMDRPL